MTKKADHPYDYSIPTTLVVEKDELNIDSIFVRQHAARANIEPIQWLAAYYYVSIFSLNTEAKEIRAWRKAATMAGLSKTYNIRKKLIDNPDVQVEVESLGNRNIMVVNERLGDIQITTDRILAELACISFLDPRRCLDEKGNLLPLHKMNEVEARAVQSLEWVLKKKGKKADWQPKIKFANKMAALELLMKYKGMLQTNVNVLSRREITHKTQITEFRTQLENLSVDELETFQRLLNKAQQVPPPSALTEQKMLNAPPDKNVIELTTDETTTVTTVAPADIPG